MDDYQLTKAFPYLLNRVGVRMGELFSRHLAPHGLTLPMYRVMAALRECTAMGLGELAATTTVELSTLSRLVGTMSRQGLVSRQRVPGNARTVDISLTPSGRRLLETLIPVAVMHEDEALRGFAAEDAARLRGALLRVHENLSAMAADPASERTPARPARRTR
ncbi:MarR family winged helix-turn-helix transcriptional regulator [Muricoccus vinaceus]|uniref:MarR family winged helix-turn-helix transcriptional regulator n=1 Tax=Muricoccus vinaceus TaxID=424704 RepID=A0ABV6J0M1_9PROT